MATLSENHKTLNEIGGGKCSVPMWCGGLPDGFCGRPAYSLRQKESNYNGYVPALACPAHGGKTKESSVNLCVNCTKEIATCNGNPKFGTGVGNDNVYECDFFLPPPPKKPNT
jgi:hypothetical protein